MIEDVVVPKWGLTADELVLVEWLCKVGDEVKHDQALAILESDKATGELLSPFPGVVHEILATPGDEVEPGQIVLKILRT